MDHKTKIREFFEAVEDKLLPQAKRLITDVSNELMYLEKANLNLSAVTCISEIRNIVHTVERGQIDVAWGKFNPLKAKYSAQLESYLKQNIRERDQVVTLPLQDSSDQLSSGSRLSEGKKGQRPQESYQLHNESDNLLRGEKKNNRQHSESEQLHDRRKEFIENVYQPPATDHMRDKYDETLRLDKSKRASQLLMHKNPDITDLSDTNRPTKLAERFSELYDNEWTEAYEAMSKGKPRHVEEKQIIEFLLKMVENAYTFCSKNISPLKKKLREGKIVQLDERNQFAASEIQHLQQKFCEINEIRKNDAIEQYAKKAVELAFWMNLQDPPVHMVFSQQSNNEFDPNLYRAYTRSGRDVAFLVWPPLTLYEGGGVLCKGVVQCK